jgi:hypothetical protein
VGKKLIQAGEHVLTVDRHSMKYRYNLNIIDLVIEMKDLEK